MRKAALLAVVSIVVAAMAEPAVTAPRARDLGIPFSGEPGPLNAITDVAGVTVGHVTIIEDLPDKRAARTGVTAILPRGMKSKSANVYAAWTPLNGNGEMTGTTWIEESGFLEGPVMITNTHSVGAVHEGVIRWRVAAGAVDNSGYFWSLPVVAETWDGDLNDINGFHVRPHHAGQALDRSSGGPVAEGSIGGGTGMICFEFKCGIGTASRRVAIATRSFMLGVLVQANFGSRRDLRIAGLPVGIHMPVDGADPDSATGADTHGSIIAVVATDAPLLPPQLKRLARRVALGIGATGGVATNGSGDIFLAFSTANFDAGAGVRDADIRALQNDDMNPLFRATVQATEEAIVNALVAGRDMRGDRGHTVRGIDHEAIRNILRRHARLAE